VCGQTAQVDLFQRLLTLLAVLRRRSTPSRCRQVAIELGAASVFQSMPVREWLAFVPGKLECALRRERHVDGFLDGSSSLEALRTHKTDTDGKFAFCAEYLYAASKTEARPE
jgi:hypothetical protein